MVFKAIIWVLENEMFHLTENMTSFQSSISHHTEKGKKLLDRENQNTKTT